MAQRYFLKRALLSSGLLLATIALHAQSLAPDSAQAAQRPPTLLGKVGLRLTRLRYSHANQIGQFLLPLSLGAEYRAASRVSLYTQLEADMLTSYASGRRRGGQNSALSAASVALGVRYYYGRAHQAAPIFGRYLALEGGADWEQLATSTSQSTRRRRSTPAVLTPGVFALWGSAAPAAAPRTLRPQRRGWRAVSCLLQRRAPPQQHPLERGRAGKPAALLQPVTRFTTTTKGLPRLEQPFC